MQFPPHTRGCTVLMNRSILLTGERFPRTRGDVPVPTPLD